MKIAIVSDSHDNTTNFEKAFKYFEQEGIKTVLHAGDICAPSMIPNMILPNYNGELYFITGNVSDRVKMEERKNTWRQNIHYMGDTAEIEIADKKFLVIHEPENLESLASSGKFDVIVYGHTHETDVKKINDALIINPGTLGGVFFEASFGLYDTETNQVEIKLVSDIK